MAMTGFSHPKCYLSFTNDCSSSITKEHYISDSLLKLLEQGNTVKITGLRWIEKQTFKLIARKSLTAHILCAKHNNGLSGLDTEMLHFFEAVKQIEEALKRHKIRGYLEFSLDGHKIERWLIKLCCGIIASNQVPDVDQVVVRHECYDYLISGTAMPENWGLYFSGENRQFDTSIDFSIRYASGELKALDFSVHNFVHTHLVLGRPDNPLTFGTYRPHNLVFRSTAYRVDHNIELKWLVDRRDLAVIYTRIGSTDTPPRSPAREHDSRHVQIDESWQGCGLLADLAYASLARLRACNAHGVRFVIRLKDHWKPEVDSVARGHVTQNSSPASTSMSSSRTRSSCLMAGPLMPTCVWGVPNSPCICA